MLVGEFLRESGPNYLGKFTLSCRKTNHVELCILCLRFSLRVSLRHAKIPVD